MAKASEVDGVLSAFKSFAQFPDSTIITVGARGQYSSSDYQPLWLVANKYGTVADQKGDFSPFIRASSRHVLATLGYSQDTVDNSLYLKFGGALYANNYLKKAVLPEAYAILGYKNWALRFGRFQQITGDVDPELSTGSLGISGNSLPIPKIDFAVTEYTNVPWTRGFLKFKGNFSYGWFGNNRYMKEALYHEKTFYMQMGRGRLKVYGGLLHVAEWAGKRGRISLDRSFKGFLDVVLVNEADDGSVGTDQNGLRPSRAGDQRGLLEGGMSYEGNTVNLRGYVQVPFESGEEVDYQNRSALLGLVIAPTDQELKLKRLLVEILYTKEMTNWVFSGQRQTLYNNGYYKTGWEYEGMVVGTPLFMNRNRANKYFPEIVPYNWDAPNNSVIGNTNIVNNMLMAVHLGSVYQVTDAIAGKTLVTYVRNYGSLKTGPFFPVKVQFHAGQELTFRLPETKWDLKLGVGLDFGDLGTTIGGMLQYSYRVW
ncbi:MAG: hypothetical protein EOO97_00325 [Pedobacter sp.]|nr:MAG: hypothetical protein EOO97_00325 [Pedobacter sp.]